MGGIKRGREAVRQKRVTEERKEGEKARKVTENV
jgi:hypothetical protein